MSLLSFVVCPAGDDYSNQVGAIFGNYVAEIHLDGKPVQLALCGTAGREEYEVDTHGLLTDISYCSLSLLRPLSYSKSHVILIAFSIDTPDSLDNWMEEVWSVCGQAVPMLLVGCKADLRAWVSQLGSCANEGLDNAFEPATRASMLMREGTKSQDRRERQEDEEREETFYRKEIETDINTSAPKSAEGRNGMLGMLRNFEDGNAEESDGLTEDGDDLARTLKDINLAPDVILSMLSPPQQESFLKVIWDPSNELAQQLLSSPELQRDRRRPWWDSSMLEGDEIPINYHVFGVPPQMMSIAQALTAPKEAFESHLIL
ncbi:hypothetical protein JB92DRAFT_3129757 [Gautieria morchelliformis]|nr:hypothetical protein JB92DRAFT_3129757 [Gautieria morchelliformis]